MGWHSDEPDNMALPALAVWFALIFAAAIWAVGATREAAQRHYELRQQHIKHQLHQACLAGGRDWNDGVCR